MDRFIPILFWSFCALVIFFAFKQKEELKNNFFNTLTFIGKGVLFIPYHLTKMSMIYIFWTFKPEEVGSEGTNYALYLVKLMMFVVVGLMVCVIAGFAYSVYDTAGAEKHFASAKIVDKGHTPGHHIYISNGKGGGYYQYIPPSWSVDLEFFSTDSGETRIEEIKGVSVSKDFYNTYVIGEKDVPCVYRRGKSGTVHSTFVELYYKKGDETPLALLHHSAAWEASVAYAKTSASYAYNLSFFAWQKVFVFVMLGLLVAFVLRLFFAGVQKSEKLANKVPVEVKKAVSVYNQKTMFARQKTKKA